MYTGTYDVQSVSGTAIAGGLELSCTFAEGSCAQSCILTVCRMENGKEESCMDIIIGREDTQTSGRIMNLQPGLYVVREVAEVESEGQVTIHNRRSVLELMITTSGLFKLHISGYAPYILLCRKPSYRWHIKFYIFHSNRHRY